MSLRFIGLGKLLRILYLPQNRQTSELRSDIRADINREAHGSSGGGDFYTPFWRDAKDHVFEIAELHVRVDARILENPRRANLYPQLRDGFLQWWNERRRWTNSPFVEVRSPHARHQFAELGTVKVENMLGVRDAGGAERYIYPYFAPVPVLSEEAARVGLWIVQRALPNTPIEAVRILDVVRGRTFSVDRTPFDGREERLFFERYRAALARWDELRDEY